MNTKDTYQTLKMLEVIDLDDHSIKNVSDIVESTHRKRIQELQGRYRKNSTFLVLVIILFLGFSIGSSWFAQQLPSVPLPAIISVDHIQMLGTDSYCPGDTMTYSFEINVISPGVFEIDRSVLRISPPTFMVLDSTVRVAIHDNNRVAMVSKWTIPEHGISPNSEDALEWESGNYSQIIAITTANRNTEPTIVSIPFKIRDDCSARAS